MRIACVMILLAASAFAQDQSAAACGPKDTSFDVKLDKSQHTLEEPEPGKARVYFVQDIGVMSCLGSCATIKIWMNGAWVRKWPHARSKRRNCLLRLDNTVCRLASACRKPL